MRAYVHVHVCVHVCLCVWGGGGERQRAVFNSGSLILGLLPKG